MESATSEVDRSLFVALSQAGVKQTMVVNITKIFTLEIDNSVNISLGGIVTFLPPCE